MSTHSLCMYNPSQPVFSYKQLNLFHSRHLPPFLTPYLVIQCFPTHHPKHSHFCGLQSPEIVYLHCPIFCSISYRAPDTALIQSSFHFQGRTSYTQNLSHFLEFFHPARVLATTTPCTPCTLCTAQNIKFIHYFDNVSSQSYHSLHVGS